MKILIIQTAFIGDVILATPLIEKLHRVFHEPSIDFLLRKGNESLFEGHPFLRRVIVWDKTKDKFRNLIRIAAEIRYNQYDLIVNVHRFASSGFITFLSGCPQKAGFDKNPFSSCYTKKVKHIIGDGLHEVERNLKLIDNIELSVDNLKPRLYPQPQDYEKVIEYKSQPYICIVPASVWFTKQLPVHKWMEFVNSIHNFYLANRNIKIYLLGAESDAELCEQLISSSTNKNMENLAGKLSFLQSAALMKDAQMNYCNDSASLHIASSMNAPVTALFLSTVPSFGFGPLSDKSFIVETKVKLDCKPCGIHGYRQCPQKHFKCAETIKADQLLDTLQK